MGTLNSRADGLTFNIAKATWTSCVLLGRNVGGYHSVRFVKLQMLVRELEVVHRGNRDPRVCDLGTKHREDARGRDRQTDRQTDRQ